MKYRITEEQLANLIEESTKKILSEAIENEGLGSSIMKGLGSAAGKAMQHVSNWGNSFRQGYNQYYNGGGSGYGQNTQGGQGGQEQSQILQRLSTEIENMKQQISALEQGNPQQQQQPQQPQPQQPQQPQPQQPQPKQPSQNRKRRK